MKYNLLNLNNNKTGTSCRIVYFFIAVGLMFSQLAVAQKAMTPSMVKQKANKALSSDKLLSKKNINYVLTTAQGSATRSVRVVAKEADKAAIEVDNYTLVAHNGSYFMRTLDGVIDITDKQLIQQIENYMLPIRALSLVNWKEAKSASGDIDNLGISQGEDKSEVKLWFDKKNLLPTKIERWQEWNNETYLATTLIEAYTKVQGINIPTSLKTIHNTSRGVFETTQLITDISFDKDIDQDSFKAVKKK